MKFRFIYISLLLGLGIALYSCNEDTNYGPDPYAGGLSPLGIQFSDQAPSPSQARVGGQITFKVSGLLNHKDDLKLYLNNTEAEVLEITDSTVTTKLPEGVSTGNAKIVVRDQIFSGPIFKVIGKTNIDPTFSSGKGTDGPIYNITVLPNTNLLLCGSFSDYNGASLSNKIGSMVRITNNGELVRLNNNGGAATGLSSGSILSTVLLPGNKLLIGGAFATYADSKLPKNMSTVNLDGSLITKSVPILNTTEDPANSFMTVPEFNGGANRAVSKLFYSNNKIYALGGFDGYTSNYYVRSTVDNILSDFFLMKGVIRMNIDGSLDSTYFINRTSFPPKSYEGANGTISDALLAENDKLLLVGSFNRFNGQTVAGGIVQLDDQGLVDNTFKAGSGADNEVSFITKANDGGYFLVGSFKNYNGSVANGIVEINKDGTINPHFVAKQFSGGKPTFAKQLSNGLVLVTGTFTMYDSVVREGIVILHPDGSIAREYNNVGKLTGSVFVAHEGKNNLGITTVLLGGWISSFSGQNNVGNIVRLTLQD